MSARVKICGLTRPEDIDGAVECGADALGLVFYGPSPRSVSVEQAVELAKRVPAFVSVVGLFVNPSRQEVEAVLDRVSLDLLQFHGDENADFCSGFGRRWIKAIRVREAAQIEAAFDEFRDASGLLVDAWDQTGTAGRENRLIGISSRRIVHFRSYWPVGCHLITCLPLLSR